MPHPLRAQRRRLPFRLVVLVLAAMPSVAFAADCGNDAAGFNSWLGRFKARAAADQRAPTRRA